MPCLLKLDLFLFVCLLKLDLFLFVSMCGVCMCGVYTYMCMYTSMHACRGQKRPSDALFYHFAT